MKKPSLISIWARVATGVGMLGTAGMCIEGAAHHIQQQQSLHAAIAAGFAVPMIMMAVLLFADADACKKVRTWSPPAL